jgi:hypothetical protein
LKGGDDEADSGIDVEVGRVEDAGTDDNAGTGVAGK